ncbi:SDR family NAD(P)-dependent oxidoreductase [Streptomyces sp. NPDC007157]|uniref:SDR family NAD(P)-dependent oxidoreductase n=1 Tax=Streptomyces sp. NPDC007157 TaxID=3154681 RepID=UPI0034086248
MSRRVLITGGASGLGWYLAQRYAAAGDRVLITDRNEPAGLPTGTVSFIRLDVRVHHDWQRALSRCEDHWGDLDVLVDDAGVKAVGRGERLHDDDWDRIVDIDLKGAVHGSRTFIPLFKRQGSGHVVNIAAPAGLLNLPGMASHNVSKAAVICPGFVQTNLRTDLHSPDPVPAKQADRMMRRGKPTADQVVERIVDAVGAGRFPLLTHSEDRRAVRLRRFLPRIADAQAAVRWRRTVRTLKAQDQQERVRTP